MAPSGRAGRRRPRQEGVLRVLESYKQGEGGARDTAAAVTKEAEPVRRPKAQTDRVKQRKAREEVLVVDIDDSPQRDEGKEDDYGDDAFEEDISQQLERSAIGAATWRRDVGPGATLVHRRADARGDDATTATTSETAQPTTTATTRAGAM